MDYGPSIDKQSIWLTQGFGRGEGVWARLLRGDERDAHAGRHHAHDDQVHAHHAHVLGDRAEGRGGLD